MRMMPKMAETAMAPMPIGLHELVEDFFGGHLRDDVVVSRRRRTSGMCEPKW